MKLTLETVEKQDIESKNGQEIDFISIESVLKTMPKFQIHGAFLQNR